MQFKKSIRMVPAMEIQTYLYELRKADRQVASMPKCTERSIIQEAIGRELNRLLKLQQVEGTKGPYVELEPRHVTSCAVDAETPLNP